MSKRKEREDEGHQDDYERLIKKQKSKGKSKDNFGDFSSW